MTEYHWDAISDLFSVSLLYCLLYCIVFRQNFQIGILDLTLSAISSTCFLVIGLLMSCFKVCCEIVNA